MQLITIQPKKMKNRYERYGARTEEIYARLSEQDRKILASFLDLCAVTSSPGRIKKYRMYILQFRDVIEKPLDQVTHSDAIRFWGLVKNAPYEDHTKVDIKRSVKRFLKFFYRDMEMIEPLVIQRHPVNNKKLNKQSLITEEELQLMLRAAQRLQDKALILVLYETAARPNEIRRLKWKDINWKEEEIHLYSSKKKTTRDLPVHLALHHLRRWKEEWYFLDPEADDYIFPSVVGSL